MKKLALVGLAGVVAAMGIAAPGVAGGNKYASDHITQDCNNTLGKVGEVRLDGPLSLWPPNHKFIGEPVTVTSTDNGEQVSITLYPELSDETGGDGGAQHDPDAQMTDGSQSFTASGPTTATAALQLRAERSGKGDGRTYTINWLATFGNDSCDSRSSSTDDYVPYVITVPHDMGGGADWK